MKIVDRILPT